MASEGPNGPGTGTNNASVGTLAWTDPGNITTDDGSPANAAATGETLTSNYLLATNFGFSIPDGATIDGVQVAVQRAQQGAQGTTTDNSIRLFSAGSATGDNKAAVGNWSLTEETADYGGVSDVWGATLDADTVNAATFGVGISATVAGGPQGISAQVDYVTMTITYTAGGGGGGGSSQSSTIAAGRWVNGERRKYNRLISR